VIGRPYLIYATAMSVLLTVSLSVTSRAGFSSGLPLLLPIFVAVGAMGGLTVFTSDRLKGVLEYLMAYGVTPRRLFLNVLLASFVLVTIVLGVALGVGVGLNLARRTALPLDFALAVGLYTVPMSYASVAFSTTIGMYWSALSSPRQGLNSPVGLAPFIGILPSVATLAAVIALGANGVSASAFFTVAVIAMALVTIVVVLLLSMIGRLLRRERLLSPA